MNDDSPFTTGPIATAQDMHAIATDRTQHFPLMLSFYAEGRPKWTLYVQAQPSAAVRLEGPVPTRDEMLSVLAAIHGSPAWLVDVLVAVAEAARLAENASKRRDAAVIHSDRY